MRAGVIIGAGKGNGAIDTRDILFKAKRLDNGEWVKGNLITDERTGKVFIGYIFGVIDGKIEDFDVVEVDKETVCQYVGKFNGQKVWENDIVQSRYLGMDMIGIVKFGDYQKSGQVHVGFYIDWEGNCEFREDLRFWLDRDSKVIGNAFGGKQNG